MLTFYNAIANNGKMVKPLFVREIRKRGKQVKYYNTEVINEKICSEGTIKKVREMMEGVVENGTASNLKNPHFKVAGKTGTAQIANTKFGYNKVSYQASFCGYFPADNPLYSCVIVVYSPSNSVYYGGFVAGPIFREIADKVYSTRIDLHKNFEEEPLLTEDAIPVLKAGYTDETQNVLKGLGYDKIIELKEAEWFGVNIQDKSLKISERSMKRGHVPNVIGMGLKDAIYLLESYGLKVMPGGRGTVVKQSLTPGLPVSKGSTIYLELT